MVYLSYLSTDYYTGIINCSDPKAFVAKTRYQYNPDNTSYNESMTWHNAQDYRIAMHKDIYQPIKKYTWCIINQNTLQKLPNGKSTVSPGTWLFKLKRLPDGSPLKFKAKYCVQGDKQTGGVDYFETYAPVVSWYILYYQMGVTLSKWTIPMPFPKQTSNKNSSSNLQE